MQAVGNKQREYNCDQWLLILCLLIIDTYKATAFLQQLLDVTEVKILYLHKCVTLHILHANTGC